MMIRITVPVVAVSLTVAVFLSLSAAGQTKDSRTAATVKEVKFEVLSIRPLPPGLPSSQNFRPTPNGYSSSLSIWQAILIAYVSTDATTWINTQVLNGPTWSGEFYDFNGRVSQADLKAWQSQSVEHELLRSAMRAALRDRCKLAIHEEPSVQPTHELVIGKRGPQLKETVPSSTPPTGVKLKSGGVMVSAKANGRQVWHCYWATMDDLAHFLNMLGHGIPVRDKTGLTGRYDFTIEEIAEPARDETAVYNYPVGHLGLMLKPGKENRPTYVIDHIEKPSAN